MPDSVFVELYTGLWARLFGLERYARKSSPGQMSLFGDDSPAGGEHDVSKEPRDAHGEWTAGGVKESEKPDVVPADNRATLGQDETKPALEDGKMSQLAIDLRGLMGVIGGRDKLLARLEGVTDEEAIQVASELGLPNVQGNWSLGGAVGYTIAQAEQEQRNQIRAKNAGLTTQPKHRIPAKTLPEKQPLEMKFLQYEKVRQQTRGRGKTMPRQPKDGEALAVLRRPQASPKTPGGAGRGFVMYKDGDVVNSDGRRYVVQAAAKEGYTRSDEDNSFKQWEQLAVLRAATDEDVLAIDDQQAAQDNDRQDRMDRAMNS